MKKLIVLTVAASAAALFFGCAKDNPTTTVDTTYVTRSKIILRGLYLKRSPETWRK